MAETSMAIMIPIRTCMSAILPLDQVWSNSVSTDQVLFDNDRSVETPNSRDMETFDDFAQRLIEKHLAKQESSDISDQKTKKSRQVFTYSQSTAADYSACYVVNGIEVYESLGGQEMGWFCGMEPLATTALVHVNQTKTADQISSERTVPTLQEPIRSSFSEMPNCEISYPKLKGIHSNRCVRTCFPRPVKHNLFYTVSDSSLPIVKHSSKKEERRKEMPSLFLKVNTLPSSSSSNMGSPTSPPCPSYVWFEDPNSVKAEYELREGRSTLFDTSHADFLVSCNHMDCRLVQQISETIQNVESGGRLGKKFLSYAKFNSSFKLPEIFYEDVNHRTISRVSPSTQSFQLFHKVNPDFDEDQSVTDAPTIVKSLSSLTSVSRITKVRCQKPELETERKDTFLLASLNFGTSKTQHADVKEQQILSDTLPDAHQNELNLRSSSSSTTFFNSTTRSVPKRIVDIVSPSCIFRSGHIEGKKHPFWQLKVLNNPREDRKADSNDEFTAKAYYYMSIKEHPYSRRCFFQPQPTCRVVDECIQFPDVDVGRDRSPNVMKPMSENHIPNKAPIDVGMLQGEPKMNCLTKPVQAVLDVREQVSSPKEELPENLTVIVSSDSPLYASSNYPTAPSSYQNNTCRIAVPVPRGNEESSSNAPASSSSHKCKLSSSEYQSNATASAAPRRTKRDVQESNLEPAMESPTPTCKKTQRKPSPLRHFCRSYRAICDKRKIRIKYENGRYTVLKEMDRTKRQTIWSILTGKATHLLSSVVRRKRCSHRSSGR